MTEPLTPEEKARAADHYWPSNHAHYMPEPCGEILTEWLYPIAEALLAALARAKTAERRIERLEAALREIRALDHDAFDTPFRYEQALRGIAHSALDTEEGA